MDLASVAEELYSLHPGEFVARRTALAAEAKANGDKQLTATIKGLAKPTTAAWAVNMLVRHEADQVTQVLDLGAALREAQASMSGDDLRALGRQRRQLVTAVTRQARVLARDLGQTVGEPVAAQVADTLHAAMVDEDVAAAVRTGLLTRPLAVTGLDPVDVTSAVAYPEALGEHVVRRAPAMSNEPSEQESGRPELTLVEDSSRAIEEAQAVLERAEEAVQAAERRLAKAVGKVEKREAKLLQLHAELEELHRRVAQVEQRIEDNDDALAGAEDTRDERAAAVEEARDEAATARKALEDLG